MMWANEEKHGIASSEMTSFWVIFLINVLSFEGGTVIYHANSDSSAGITYTVCPLHSPTIISDFILIYE